MKYFTLMLLLMGICNLACAQKESYDIVKYQLPAGWKKEATSTAMSFSKIDGASWGQIAIYKSTKSKGDIHNDIQNEWEAIVLAAHKVDSEEQAPIDTVNNWLMTSKSGTWKFNDTNVATILTTFSNGEICISILCNATAQPYLKDFQQLISSLEFETPQNSQEQAPLTSPVPDTSGTINQNQIVGLWTSYINETSGYINNMPQTTGGYFRKEYKFNTDGSYVFLEEDFPAYSNNIFFKYEMGNWAINGNQLTIIPTKGKNETWSKGPNNKPQEWGKKLKTQNGALEKITYTVNLKYLSGMENTYLVLSNNTATARDGKQHNNGSESHTWQYAAKPLDKALINFPPGER